MAGRPQSEPTQAHNGLPTTIHYLPLELLGDIFALVLPPDQLAAGMKEDGRGDLIQLCTVCKRWREAALLNRDLWSTLDWEMEEYDTDVLCPWFERAGGTSKALTIRTSRHQNLDAGEYPHTEQDCIFGFTELATFLREFDPWRRLHIILHDVTCLRLLTVAFLLDAPTWPVVEHLVLEVHSHWSDMSLTTILQALPAPTFKRLTFHSPVHEDCIMLEQPLKLPVGNVLQENLVELFLDCWPNPLGALEFISHCPNLLKLGISQRCHGFDIPHNAPFTIEAEAKAVPIISLPKLHALRIIRVSQIFVLNVLHLPSLRTLELEFDDVSGLPYCFPGDHKSSFAGFIERSQSTITALAFRNPASFYLHHIYGVLILFPSVVYLEISDMIWLPVDRPRPTRIDVFGMDNLQSNSMELLPRLETFRCSPQDSFLKRQFHRFNSSRARPIKVSPI